MFKCKIGSFVFLLGDDRVVIEEQRGRRRSAVFEARIADVAAIEFGQTRFATSRRRRFALGRTARSPVPGRTGILFRDVAGDTAYVEVPGTPAAIREVLRSLLDAIVSRGGVVLG
ncbi:MAG: hypothetical protein WCI50_12055 [Actinomycetes bacterium]|jgi:hypothetical protein